MTTATPIASPHKQDNPLLTTPTINNKDTPPVIPQLSLHSLNDDITTKNKKIKKQTSSKEVGRAVGRRQLVEEEESEDELTCSELEEDEEDERHRKGKRRECCM